MDFGGCREKTVDNRQRAVGLEPSPFMGHSAIDGQNAFAKGLIDGYKPLFERVGFGGVFCTDLLNATADFTNHQHAKIQTRILDFFIPSCHVLIASVTLSDFGNNISVDEIIQ